MKLAFRKWKEADEDLGVKAGDIGIVNLDYDWDSDKVEVITILKKGSYPSMSEYKSSIVKVTPEEVWDFCNDEK